MNHQPSRLAVKRSIAVELDAALLQEVERQELDLSSVLNDLLRYFMRPPEPLPPTDPELQRTIDALNAHHAKFGTLSDEFSAL